MAPAYGADLAVKAARLCAASAGVGPGVRQRAHQRLYLPRRHAVEPPAFGRAYFEPRYNITKDIQLYVGVSGESISFPNRAAAEIDLYGGFRPTFDKLAFDFGAWYYYYPGGQCFSPGTFIGLTGAQACNCFGAGGNFIALAQRQRRQEKPELL